MADTGSAAGGGAGAAVAPGAAVAFANGEPDFTDAQKDEILAKIVKITADPRISRQSPEALADPDKKYALTTEYAAYIALFL